MKLLDFTSIIYNFKSNNFIVLVAYNRIEKVQLLTGKYTRESISVKILYNTLKWTRHRVGAIKLYYITLYKHETINIIALFRE